MDWPTRHRRVRRYLGGVAACAIALSCLPLPVGPGPLAIALSAAMMALSTGMVVFSLLAWRVTMRGLPPPVIDGLPPLSEAARRTVEGVYAARTRAQWHLNWGLGGGMFAAVMWLPALFGHGTVTVLSRLGMVAGAAVMAVNGWLCIRAYREMDRTGRQGLGG